MFGFIKKKKLRKEIIEKDWIIAKGLSYIDETEKEIGNLNNMLKINVKENEILKGENISLKDELKMIELKIAKETKEKVFNSLKCFESEFLSNVAYKSKGYNDLYYVVTKSILDNFIRTLEKEIK